MTSPSAPRERCIGGTSVTPGAAGFFGNCGGRCDCWCRDLRGRRQFATSGNDAKTTGGAGGQKTTSGTGAGGASGGEEALLLAQRCRWNERGRRRRNGDEERRRNNRDREPGSRPVGYPP